MASVANMRIRTLVKIARSGDLRGRIAAARDGQAAVRVSLVGAGLETGVLDALNASPSSAAELAQRTGQDDVELLEALLHALATLGQVRFDGGHWRLARRGLVTLTDDVVRATYEGFSDYHTGLYRDLPRQLQGGSPRRDVVQKGDVIARLSTVMDPFVMDALTGLLEERHPRRIIDVGCGTGTHLAHMLSQVPAATGMGVETDSAASARAETTLLDAGLDDRARVVRADVRDVVSTGQIGEHPDFALLANVIYYLPVADRVPVLRAITDLLSPGGTLVVVSAALDDSMFSRHFDLLLRAQEGQMQLPDFDVLSDQLREAGLTPDSPKKLTPGDPLTMVVATKPL